MENKKLTLVVGAGASKELGLPVGSELKQTIASLLGFGFLDEKIVSGSPEIWGALKRFVEDKFVNLDMNPYFYAARRIQAAMPLVNSIDNFIDIHQGDREIELCGKLAIVKSILDAERASKIYVDSRKNRLNFTEVESCWITHFFRLLTENCQKEQLRERLASVAFVIFNYDRCIEHFLFHALWILHKLDPSEAAELLRDVNFYHPYGSVGRLPWQTQEGAVDFGDLLSARRLLTSAKQIKTFTEGTDPESSEIRAIQEVVVSSEKVLFLGFAFHKQNMKLISPSFPNTGSRKWTWGTAFGLSKSDCSYIKSEINRMRGSQRTEIRNDLKCADIFSEYTRGISLV